MVLPVNLYSDSSQTSNEGIIGPSLFWGRRMHLVYIHIKSDHLWGHQRGPKWQRIIYVSSNIGFKHPKLEKEVLYTTFDNIF